MTTAERLGEVLTDRGESLATAESCTGGLVASRVTDVPGASEYFDSAIVTYTYEAKLRELGVPRELLDEEGAVSEPVARAMARSIRDVAGVTWGLGTTGIAGPTGGTDEKPVGTVFVAVAHAGDWGSGDSWSSVERYAFDGSRTEIKRQIAGQALEDLLDAVESN